LIKDFGKVFQARSLAEILAAYEETGTCNVPGQKFFPIIDFIPFERIIIDPLHAFLRIGDKLLSLVICEVKKKRTIENHEKNS